MTVQTLSQIARHHLRLGKPDRLIFELDFETTLSNIGLKNLDGIISVHGLIRWERMERSLNTDHWFIVENDKVMGERPWAIGDGKNSSVYGVISTSVPFGTSL